MYKLTGENWVLRLSDNAHIPLIDSLDEPNKNQHYLAYMTWLADGGVPTPADVVSKDFVRDALNADFNEAMAAVHAGWPDYEVQTWTVQNDEARAWLAAPADAKPSTPLLSGVHNTRTALSWSEPFEDFVGRVINNSNQYTAVVAALLAVRHVSERAIDQAEDPASVKWSFDLIINEVGV